MPYTDRIIIPPNLENAPILKQLVGVLQEQGHLERSDGVREVYVVVGPDTWKQINAESGVALGSMILTNSADPAQTIFLTIVPKAHIVLEIEDH